MESQPDNLQEAAPQTETGKNDVTPYIAPSGNKPSNISLLAGAEGKILITGAVLAGIFFAYIGLLFWINPEKAQKLLGLTAVELMVGRAAGMLYGYRMALGHYVVIPVVAVVETIFVLFFYPLFALSCKQLRILKPLQNTFDKIHEKAEKNEPFVRRYGLIGLFAFVWFPLWMTGPAVGSAIGYLIEMPARKNIAAVLGGTYTSILCWALLLHNLNQQVAEYGEYAIMVMTAAVIGAIIGGHLLARAKKIHSGNNSHDAKQ
jgi:uncharacterized membrane protein